MRVTAGESARHLTREIPPAAEETIVEDSTLCQRVREGDREAFAELYRRHHQAGLRRARLIARTVNDAEDILAEAFLRIFDLLTRGAGPTESFAAYLSVVLRNLRNRPYPPPTIELSDYADEVYPQLQVEDHTDSIAENERVRAAFARLPTRWQRVLHLVEISGLSINEAASQLGLSCNALSQLVWRAREGFHTEYVAGHQQSVGDIACTERAIGMARLVRSPRGATEQHSVLEHLGRCPHCVESLGWMREVESGLTPARNRRIAMSRAIR